MLAYDCFPAECNSWLTGGIPGRPSPVAPNWTSVAVAADDHLVAQHPGRALFVCWPPRPSNEYLVSILRKHRPTVVALITQGLGPLGVDGDFYPTLAEGWQQTQPPFVLPHWPYQNDNLTIWRTRG